MSGKELPDVDADRENVYPEVLSGSSMLSSSKTLWRGISLDQRLLPSGETPEYALEEFVVTINLGQGFQVERILDRNSQIEYMFTGAVALCPMHIPQAIRWDRDANVLLLNLAPDLLTRHAVEVLDTDRIELIPHLVTKDALIHQVGLGLQTQLKTNGVQSRLYAESAAAFLAVHLLQAYSTRSFAVRKYEGGLSQQKLRQAIAYIQDHLAQEISLTVIAAHLNMSHYHFCRLFKQSTGLSLHQYVIQQRVERAKQLLLHGKLSISEIAIACGFSHQSHLTRYFKRLTGVTPKTLRKS
jgi:AraC family transcriptional regulator